jgi:UDP:flavonoid glycosyltransferase YjiC (YdhE family)
VAPVRPELFDGPPAATPADLGALPRPLAYVTFGTVPAFARAEALHAAATAAAAEAAAVVVTSGPVPPAALGPLPANVRVAAYLPQRQVLARADVLVTHGGAGSVLGGLVHGLPQLVLPQGAPSQQRCGDRLARLGAALCLDPAEQSSPNLRRSLATLLAEGAYRSAAARAADDLDRLPPVPAVADDIERSGAR